MDDKVVSFSFGSHCISQIFTS